MPNFALDRSDMVGWLADYPRQLRHIYPAGVEAGSEGLRRAQGALGKRRGAEAPFTGVLILGTGGGSAAAAYVAASLTRSRLTVPLDIEGGYTPPGYAAGGEARPLIIAVSHSGQTEETLSAVSSLPTSAASRLVVITGGGRLAEEAARLKVPCVLLPTGMQARAVMPGILAALLGVLEASGLASGGGAGFAWEIEEAAAVTDELTAEWGPAGLKEPPSPPSRLTPLQLARRVVDRLVLVYAGSGPTEGAARRWKNQIAENAKTLAHWYTIPEAHHDEVVGWEAPPYIREHLYACFLRDISGETPKMAARLDVSRELMARRVTGVTDVYAAGRSALTRVLSLCLYGDYLSCYVALLRGIDPTPAPVIAELKQEIAAVDAG